METTYFLKVVGIEESINIKTMSKLIDINIQDETAPLEAVILGTARDLGSPYFHYVDPAKWDSKIAPEEDQITDPKSRLHLMNGTYPLEADLRRENDSFARILAKYNVRVYQPITLPSTNQVFTRDIGFVIDNIFIKSNMGTVERQSEFFAIRGIVSRIAQEVWFPPQTVKVEGGDVFPFRDKIFIGQADKNSHGLRCDRTNQAAVEYLASKFPNKEVIPILLKKSDIDPKENCLHLDCCFQPIGNNDHCIIHLDGFHNKNQAYQLMDLFGGEKNAIKINKDQMYNMNSNIFSINPKVVISGNNSEEFGSLNKQIRDFGITVEEIPYSETSKMEGLLRCSTLPLRRSY